MNTIGTQLKKYAPYLPAIAVFICIRTAYPIIDIFLDSINYLQWALDGTRIAFRPLGYTWFLRLFIGFPYNYLTIVWIQFAVFLLSTYYFLQTLFRLFKPSTFIRWLCYIATLYNPISYYLINLLSADALFASFSAIWLATLLRYLYFPERKHLTLTLHLLSFTVLFFLRYNALYYPFFSVAVLLLHTGNPRSKATAIALTIASSCVLYFVSITHTQRLIGIRMLSGFSGWSIANNAIHIYNVTKVDSTIFQDKDEAMLHYFVTMRKDSSLRPGMPVPTDEYMWHVESPLKRYLFSNIRFHHDTSYTQAWWRQSAMYGHFGTTLIRHYPVAFLKSFYWPNFKRFLYPVYEAELEYGTSANLTPQQAAYLGINTTIAQQGYDKDKKDLLNYMAIIYAILTPLCIVFCLYVFIYDIAKRIKADARNNDNGFSASFVLSSFYLVSLVLLTFAHPIQIRYLAVLLIYIIMLPFLAFRLVYPKKG